MKNLLAAAMVAACLAATGVPAQTPFGGDDSGCVPDTKDHLACSNGIAKAFGKLVGGVDKCHIKQAVAAFKGTPVDDETCETGVSKSAKAKFDAAVAKLAPKCTAAVLGGAAAFESVLLSDKSNPQSLDAQNAGPYCDGTADIDPSGDDAGKIPLTADGLKCANSVAKRLGKLTAAVLKCHASMATSGFKGGSTDDESCEMAAVTKFDAGTTKILAKCPTCLDAPTQHALADSPTTGVTAQADGANFIVYPCPPTTTTTTTMPCVPTSGPPCLTCANASKLAFSTNTGSGNCGMAVTNTGTTFINLACGGLYTGGGQNTVPLPEIVPDYGNLFVDISACTGTMMTLSGAPLSETCSNQSCTGAGCFYGPPLPVPNSTSTPTSVCVVNTVSQSASGTADCSTGEASINLPLNSEIWLTGDLYLNAPGIQTCPVCNQSCNAGSNKNGPCNSDGDCPGAGAGSCGSSKTCSKGPHINDACQVDGDCCPTPSSCTGGAAGSCSGATLTNRCHGGSSYTHNGPCTPADTNLGSSGPTSLECPPDFNDIGGLPIAYALTTGTQSKTGMNTGGGGGLNTICGFCRDVSALGTGCFDGDPNPSCPSPKALTPCLTNADCPANYPDCQQKDSGAFGPAGGSVRTITETGVPGGALLDGMAHPSKLVSVFCVPPTFNSVVDNSGSLPGPGAVALDGTVQLVP